MLKLEFPQLIEFQWDRGNENKNLLKHGVSNQEVEEAFVNFSIILPDEKHSRTEKRFNLIGINKLGQALYITFTIRISQIRIISARKADRYERSIYEKEAKKIA